MNQTTFLEWLSEYAARGADSCQTIKNGSGRGVSSFRFARRGRAAARVASTPVSILAGETLTNGGWLRATRRTLTRTANVASCLRTLVITSEVRCALGEAMTPSPYEEGGLCTNEARPNPPYAL